MRLSRPLTDFFLRAKHESSDLQIALGVVIGMHLGLIPWMTLHWVCLALALLIVRMNIVAAIVSGVVFGILANFFEFAFDWIGNQILTNSGPLRDLWAWMYHAPILPWTHFNNTVVMGSTFFAIAASPLVFFSMLAATKKYRVRFVNWLIDSRIWRTWLNSRLRRYYEYTRIAKG